MPGSLSIAVVGADYPNKRGPTRRFEIAVCPPGEAVELVLEPKNPHDGNAIAVYSCRGVQLGYVNADRAQWLSGQLRSAREHKVVFQEATDFGCIVRLGWDGEQPLLPAPTPRLARRSFDPDSQLPEREFWPDDMPPEE